MSLKYVQLQELLTKEQIKYSCSLAKADDPIPKLKEYFRSIHPPLEEKGVLPDYLAYAFFYAFQQAPQSYLGDFRN